MSKTFTVRGHKVRSASMRRFIVVRVTTDKWAVMDEVVDPKYGYPFERVASDTRGFRMIFGTEAEAVEACGTGQVVKRWSTAKAEIAKRSDSIATARSHALSVGGGVVIDTVTGEEV